MVMIEYQRIRSFFNVYEYCFTFDVVQMSSSIYSYKTPFKVKSKDSIYVILNLHHTENIVERVLPKEYSKIGMRQMVPPKNQIIH